MMMMTAKVDMKKILTIIGAIAAVIIAVILFFGGDDTTATAAPISSNDARVQFLRDFGWDVTNSPKESSQVKIPDKSSEVFDRYNALQKSQGYDLGKYAGKTVMRYVYKVNNFPNATEPVIPDCTERIIVVWGPHGLGKPAGAVCHRLELVMKCLNITEDTIITEEHVRKLLVQGYQQPLAEKFPNVEISFYPPL